MRRIISVWVAILILATGLQPVVVGQVQADQGNLQERPAPDARSEFLTRAEMVALFIQAMGYEDKAVARAGEVPFPDVMPDHWAGGYIAVVSDLASQNGAVLGYQDGLFRPDGYLTESQAITLIRKVLPPMPDLKDASLAGEAWLIDMSSSEALLSREVGLRLAMQVSHLYVVTPEYSANVAVLPPTNISGSSDVMSAFVAHPDPNLQVLYAGTADLGVTLTLSGGSTVTYVPIGVSATAPSASGDGTVIYRNAWPGTDLVYAPVLGQHQVDIVLHEPPTVSAWTFAALSESLALTAVDYDYLWLNAEGQPVFGLSPMLVTDSAGAETLARLSVAGTGPWEITISVDDEWLHDAARVYPVIVDPTTHLIGSTLNGTGTFVARYDDRILVAGVKSTTGPTYGSVFRSADNGITWSPVSFSFTRDEVQPNLYRVGTTWVMLTLENGVYARYSTDQGRTWSTRTRITDASCLGCRVTGAPEIEQPYHVGQHGNTLVILTRTRLPLSRSYAGGNPMYAAVTQDGITWTTSEFSLEPILTPPKGETILWWQGRWVLPVMWYESAGSCSETGARRGVQHYALLTSTNGVDWVRSDPLFSNSITTCTTGIDVLYGAVSGTGTDLSIAMRHVSAANPVRYSSVVLSSPDGVTWRTYPYIQQADPDLVPIFTSPHLTSSQSFWAHPLATTPHMARWNELAVAPLPGYRVPLLHGTWTMNHGSVSDTAIEWASIRSVSGQYQMSYHREQLPPTVSRPVIVAPTPDATVSATQSPTVTLTARAPATKDTLARMIWEYSRDGQSWSSIGESRYMPSGSDVSVPWTITDLPPGTYTIRVAAQGITGTVSPTSTQRVVITGSTGVAATVLTRLQGVSASSPAASSPISIGYLDASTLAAIVPGAASWELWVSSNDGQTWSLAVNTGIPTTDMLTAAADPFAAGPSIYYAHKVSTQSTVRYGRLTRSGATWSQTSLGSFSAAEFDGAQIRYTPTDVWISYVRSTVATVQVITRATGAIVWSATQAASTVSGCSTGYNVSRVYLTPLRQDNSAWHYYLSIQCVATSGSGTVSGSSTWLLDFDTRTHSVRDWTTPAAPEPAYVSSNGDVLWAFTARAQILSPWGIGDPLQPDKIYAHRRNHGEWVSPPAALVADLGGRDITSPTWTSFANGSNAGVVAAHGDASGGMVAIARSGGRPSAIWVLEYDPADDRWLSPRRLEFGEDVTITNVSLAGSTTPNRRWIPMVVSGRSALTGEVVYWFAPLPNSVGHVAPQTPQITSPSATVGASTQVSWTYHHPGGIPQVKARVFVYRWGVEVPSWDSGILYTSAQTHLVPTQGLSSGPYHIRVMVADQFDTWSSLSEPINITVDTTPPVVTSFAINGGQLTTSSRHVTLSITATDSGTGVHEMSLSLDGGATWDVWRPYTTSLGHTLPGSGAHLLALRVRDKAGNESAPRTATILVDPDPPVISGITLNGGAAYTRSRSISITLAGSDIGSGIADYRISGDGGATWGNWNPYRESFTYTVPTGDGYKIVAAQLRDRAGSLSGIVTASITLDTVAPTGSLSAPATSSGSTVTLRLHATDPAPSSGLESVALRQNGGAWSAWQPFATTLDVVVGNGTHEFQVKYRDSAGNESPIYSATTTVTVSSPPSVQLSINGGASETSSAVVTLGIHASDAVTSASQLQMRLSNDAVSWTPWEPYASSREWTLPPGAGIQTAHVQIRNAAGNIGSASRSITVRSGSGAPSVGVDPGVIGTPITWEGRPVYPVATNQVTLALSATGVTDMRWRLNAGAWTEWETYQSVRLLTLTPSEGLHEVEAQVRAPNGAISEPVVVYYLYDRTAPTLALSWDQGVTATTTGNARLRIMAQDNLTASHLVLRYRVDHGPWIVTPTTTPDITIGSVIGAHIVEVQAIDAAGNESQIEQISIWLLEAATRRPLTGFGKEMPNAESDLELCFVGYVAMYAACLGTGHRGAAA